MGEWVHGGTVVYDTDPQPSVGTGYGFDVHYEEPTQYPVPSLWDTAAAQAALTHAYAIELIDDVPFDVPAWGYGRTYYNPNNSFDLDGDEYYRYWGRVTRGTVAHTAAGAGGLPPDDFEPILPPGATDWAFDTLNREVLSAWMSIEFGRAITNTGEFVTDDTSVAMVGKAGGVSWNDVGTVMTGWNGGILSTIAAAPVATGGSVAVDVTPYLDATRADVPFVPIGRFVAVRRVEPGTPGLLATEPDTTPSVSLADGIGWVLTYQIACPYSFYYPDGVPVVADRAVLRRFPRDDALGFGSTGRNYPRPRGWRNVGGQP